MKKQTTRRKMLISSVAMLLVAMVALGTATFAWFTTNPTATASGLQMKATASKGLVIKTESTHSTATAAWAHTSYLNSNDNDTASKTTAVDLTPVSFDLSSSTALGTAYTVEAASDDSWEADTSAKVSTASGGIATGNYYQEKIYCKVTGGAENATLSLTSLNITTTSDDMANAIRIAIDYKGTLIGTYGVKLSRTNNYLVAPDDYVSGTTTYSLFTTTSKTFSTYSESSELGTVGTSGNDYVTVTIYLDGEDEYCYSNAINASAFITNIEVNLRVD